MENIVINASQRKLGRLASEVAQLLMGKDTPFYKRNALPIRKIEIENISKLDIDCKKKESKIYTHWTGFPGGLRKRNMSKIIDKKGYEEVFLKAVSGMLPKNKLQAKSLSNLIFK